MVQGITSCSPVCVCVLIVLCPSRSCSLGGESVHDAGEGDELCGQEESFHEWMKKCYLVSQTPTHSLPSWANSRGSVIAVAAASVVVVVFVVAVLLFKAPSQTDSHACIHVRDYKNL